MSLARFAAPWPTATIRREDLERSCEVDTIYMADGGRYRGGRSASVNGAGQRGSDRAEPQQPQLTRPRPLQPLNGGNRALGLKP